MPLPQLRSTEVNEVLNQPPAWLVRWGITAFFFVLLVLLLVSWFVRYPDLVRGDVQIFAKNLPKSIVAKTEGKLVKLWVKDSDTVALGQKIAFLESTANHEEVLALDAVTDSLVGFIITKRMNKLYACNIPVFFQLGELQKSYQVFQETLVRAKSFIGKGDYRQTRRILENDLAQISGLQSNLHQQLRNSQRDIGLTQEELKSQERLRDKGYVSRNDYRQTYSKLINKQQGSEQIKASMKNNLLSKNQKQQEILTLDQTFRQQENAVIQATHTLKSDIEAWKQRYIALSPIVGRVTFLQTLQENQLVKQGQKLLDVLPEGDGFYGEMNIGQYNFGKVKRGQEVIIKLQSYPFEEFGMVEGKVLSISDIPNDKSYFLRVSFPKGLRTSTQKIIPFRNGMMASGDIITEDKRLIERILSQLIKALERE